jgi:hypothetical protein
MYKKAFVLLIIISHSVYAQSSGNNMSETNRFPIKKYTAVKTQNMIDSVKNTTLREKDLSFYDSFSKFSSKKYADIYEIFLSIEEPDLISAYNHALSNCKEAPYCTIRNQLLVNNLGVAPFAEFSAEVDTNTANLFVNQLTYKPSDVSEKEIKKYPLDFQTSYLRERIYNLSMLSDHIRSAIDSEKDQSDIIKLSEKYKTVNDEILLYEKRLEELQDNQDKALIIVKYETKFNSNYSKLMDRLNYFWYNFIEYSRFPLYLIAIIAPWYVLYLLIKWGKRGLIALKKHVSNKVKELKNNKKDSGKEEKQRDMDKQIAEYNKENRNVNPPNPFLK